MLAPLTARGAEFRANQSSFGSRSGDLKVV